MTKPNIGQIQAILRTMCDDVMDSIEIYGLENGEADKLKISLYKGDVERILKRYSTKLAKEMGAETWGKTTKEGKRPLALTRNN